MHHERHLDRGRTCSFDDGGDLPAPLMQTAGPATRLPFAKANLTPGVRQKGFMGGDFSQLPGTFVIDRAGIVRFAHRGRSG